MGCQSIVKELNVFSSAVPDECAESRQLCSQIPMHGHVSLPHKSALCVVSSIAPTSHNPQYQPGVLVGYRLGYPRVVVSFHRWLCPTIYSEKAVTTYLSSHTIKTTIP